MSGATLPAIIRLMKGQPGTLGAYSAADVAVVNAIIDANGLKWTKADLLNGPGIPKDWNVIWSTIGAEERITELNVSYGGLTGSLDVSGLSQLTTLDCSNNELTGLPALPDGLTTLYCHINELTGLPALPDGLTTLQCHANKLTGLPVLPNSLTTLYCHNNELTGLPALPDGLTTLECYNNELTGLPVLPNSLTTLYCFNNNLTGLPALPDSLTTLQCYANELTGLPALPDGLTELHCYSNNLTGLSLNSTANYTYIDASHNYMTDINTVTGQILPWDINSNFTFSPQRAAGFVPVKRTTDGPLVAVVNTPLTLAAKVVPANATNQNIQWSVSIPPWGDNSTNSSITNGVFTATETGTVNVMAVIPNGIGTGFNYATSYTITIIDPIACVTLSPATATLKKGESQPFSATLDGAPDKRGYINWSVDSSSGSTISADGVLKVSANEMAKTLTVTAAFKGDSTKSATAVVTVPQPPDPVTGGGSTPAASQPAVTGKQPDMPTTGEAGITGTVTDQALAVTVSDQTIKDVIKAAQDAARKAGKAKDGIKVVLPIHSSTGYEDLSVTLSRESLDALIKAGVNSLTIGSAGVDLTLNQKALEAVHSQTTGSITVSAAAQHKLSVAAKGWIGSRPVFDITIRDSEGVTVSDLKGGTATIGIACQPAGGEKTGNLCAVYVDADGKPQLLPHSSYTDGRLIFTRASLSVYGVGYKTPAPAFTDTVNHWAEDHMDFAASRGYLTGTSASKFSPDAAVTRGDFLTALGRLSGADVSAYKTGSFTDVPDTDPAMPYIAWAVENGIARGIGDNQFNPDGAVTREQMAVMMAGYAEAVAYPLPVSRQSAAFADHAEISSWAKESVKALQQTGVISGRQDSLFAPQGDATRAEASAVLHRFVELVTDEGTARGWVQNDAGQWQYINADGKMAVNTTIDGHKVGEDGVRK